MTNVAVASNYARRIVEIEARRSGTTIVSSIHSVARKLKTSHNSVYGLLFKLPKKVSFELYCALEDAVIREIAAEIGALRDELAAVDAGRVRRDPGEIAEIQEDLARLQERLKRREARQ